MLRRLRIENLVLIREAELAFAPGLNAITGETGAGKTILAQAVGLLLGAKGDAALRRPGRARRPTSRPSSTCPTGCWTRTASRRSPSCGRRTRTGSCSPGVSSPTGGRAPTRGAASAAARGAGSPRRAADRDVRPVRAAPARATRVPARGARLVHRRRAAARGEPRRAQPGARCRPPAAGTTS